MELNNIIFPFLLLFFSYFISKYFLYILKQSNKNLLIDNQFQKPQAFHEKSTYRLGGTIIFLSLVFLFSYLFFYQNIFLFEYITFCSSFFILGLIDDLKIDLKPKFRLFLMTNFLIALIIFNETNIELVSLKYLDNLMQVDIFALFFVCLCFLFIINGANLIDGFNGLLGLHSLIILGLLSWINLYYGNYNFSYILFNISLIILIFIIFNFPRAKMFLGDGGAYLVGILIAISSIKTNNLIPSISSFFFCILLFYLFVEVFFSFFRKIFLKKQNPLLPDKEHLHMLVYKFLLNKYKNKSISNYKVSIYINSTYMLLIFPGLVFMNNGSFCRYYFLFLLFIYTYLYKILYSKVKKIV